MHEVWVTRCGAVSGGEDLDVVPARAKPGRVLRGKLAHAAAVRRICGHYVGNVHQGLIAALECVDTSVGHSTSPGAIEWPSVLPITTVRDRSLQGRHHRSTGATNQNDSPQRDSPRGSLWL